VGGDPALAPYEAFGWFLLVWAGKGVLEGLGGSAGSAYMAQRYYAARTDAECRKIAMLWTVLFAFRWPLVLGFAVLAVKLGVDATAPDAADTLLSRVLLSDYFPTGVRGLIVAAMLAAAMSTFDSTINAGASYLVRDIYEVWRGQPGPRERVWAGYVASVLIVALGLVIALLAGASVIGVWVNIVMLLFPAFLVPFALRWYWARFNGAGFAPRCIFSCAIRRSGTRLCASVSSRRFPRWPRCSGPCSRARCRRRRCGLSTTRWGLSGGGRADGRRWTARSTAATFCGCRSPCFGRF
jgi:Na+/proline symporter